MNSAEHFEAIVGQHYEPLFRFAMSLTRMQSDAEDLTQYTFFVWATKGHQLRDLTKVKTWLFTTLHRAFLKARHGQSRFSAQDWEELADQSASGAAEFSATEDISRVLPAWRRWMKCIGRQ